MIKLKFEKAQRQSNFLFRKPSKWWENHKKIWGFSRIFAAFYRECNLFLVLIFVTRRQYYFFTGMILFFWLKCLSMMCLRKAIALIRCIYNPWPHQQRSYQIDDTLSLSVFSISPFHTICLISSCLSPYFSMVLPYR